MPSPTTISALLALAWAATLLGLWRAVVRARRAEQQLVGLRTALIEQQASLDAAGLGAHDGLWEWDPDTDALQVSARWRELAGVAPGTSLKTADAWLARVHPDDADLLSESLRRQAHDQDAVLQREFRLRGDDDQWRWMRIRAMSHARPDGSRRRVTGSQTDITRARSAEDLGGAFFAMVSHELRSPLTSIVGALGLARSGLMGKLEPELAELIQIAERNARRLAHDVDDLLDLGSARDGTLSLNPAAVSLPALVDRMIDATQEQVEAERLRLVVNRPVPDVSVMADGDRLHQILVAMVGHGARSSGPDATVQVSVREGQGWLRVQVINRGGSTTSMERSDLPGLGEPAPPAVQPSHELGLSMTVAQHVAQCMGGALGVRAVGDVRLTWIDLPVAP